jgi:putative FmdB family regulatory protein
MLKEWQCPKCGHKFEELQKNREAIKCPKCGAVAKEVKISLSAYGKNSSWPVR